MRDSGKCIFFDEIRDLTPYPGSEIRQNFVRDAVMEQETVFGMREVRDAGLSLKKSGMRD